MEERLTSDFTSRGNPEEQGTFRQTMPGEIKPQF
jgi:hypothetical protein